MPARKKRTNRERIAEEATRAAIAEHKTREEAERVQRAAMLDKVFAERGADAARQRADEWQRRAETAEALIAERSKQDIERNEKRRDIPFEGSSTPYEWSTTPDPRHNPPINAGDNSVAVVGCHIDNRPHIAKEAAEALQECASAALENARAITRIAEACAGGVRYGPAMHIGMLEPKANASRDYAMKA